MQFFRSKYVAYLESEVERLRVELARWQDAALIREGLPPITPREPRTLPKLRAKVGLPSQWIRKMQNLSEITPHEETQA